MRRQRGVVLVMSLLLLAGITLAAAVMVEQAFLLVQSGRGFYLQRHLAAQCDRLIVSLVTQQPARCQQAYPLSSVTGYCQQHWQLHAHHWLALWYWQRLPPGVQAKTGVETYRRYFLRLENTDQHLACERVMMVLSASPQQLPVILSVAEAAESL